MHVDHQHNHPWQPPHNHHWQLTTDS
jgi:hypothetical protein